MKMTREQLIVINDIAAERERQNTKWGGAKHDDKKTIPEWALLIQDYAGAARLEGYAHSYSKSREKFLQVAALAAAACESLDRQFLKGSQEYSDEIPVQLPEEIRALHAVLREIVKETNITKRWSVGKWNGEPYFDDSNGIKIFKFDTPAQKSLSLLNGLRSDIESEGNWHFVRGDKPCGYWKLEEIDQCYFFSDEATEAVALARSIRDAIKFVIR